MALRAALTVVLGVALASALCGCGNSAAPAVAPGDQSNKPDILQGKQSNTPGTGKGAFFKNQPGAGAGTAGAPPATTSATGGSQ